MCSMYKFFMNIFFLRICFFILSVLQGSNAQSQIVAFLSFPRDFSKMEVIDFGNIRIWYALNAVNINNPDTFDDLQCLEVGSHLSKYYSYFTYKSDSLCTEWRKQHKEAESAPTRCFSGGKQNNKWSEYYYSDYIKDFSTGKLTQYTYMPRNISHSSYTEDIPIPEWTLCEETDTIINYLCQKATCSFRGRNFVAWFTPDVPINNGPWKFGGLPGLILKVYDLDSQYIFECVKIENIKQGYSIKMYNSRAYTLTDRKKFQKLISNINNDYFKLAGWSFEGGRQPINIRSLPPLELE